MNSLIRSLIRETLLTEEVYGAQAIVYHGTKADPQKLITSLLYKAKIEPGKARPSQEELDKEFKPGIGAGAMYGKGLYAVYDLKRLEDGSYADTKTAAGEYGPTIIKLKVNLYGYIIFDPFVASTVYKKPLTVVEQAEMLGLNKNLIEKLKKVRTEERNNTSDAALEASKFLKGRVRGLVYTGSRDGRCILAYDATTVAPIAWKAIGDESWTPVDRNSLKTYFRRRASEDWQEEKYEMSVEKRLKELHKLPIEERIWQGDLDLRHSTVMKLPDGLKINGSLELRDSNIVKLPAGLKISKSLRLDRSNVSELPADIIVGKSIRIGNSKITSLPAGLNIGGTLNITNSNITSLPAGLKIGGNFELADSKVTSLPAGLKVGGTLDLSNSKVASIAAGLRVGKDIYFGGSEITTLPNDIKINGDANFSYSKIASLPVGFEVGGDLTVGYSKIDFLPAGLKVGGWLYLYDSNIGTIPKDLQVGKQILGFSGNKYKVPQHLKDKLK